MPETIYPIEYAVKGMPDYSIRCRDGQWRIMWIAAEEWVLTKLGWFNEWPADPLKFPTPEAAAEALRIYITTHRASGGQ